MLERLCQYGAGALLIPFRFLESRRSQDFSAFEASDLLVMSHELRVSVEAVIRRLDGLSEFNPLDSVHLLVERDHDELLQWRIVATRCGEWFAAKFGRPVPYSSLCKWLRQSPKTIDEILEQEHREVNVGKDKILCTVFSLGHRRYILKCRWKQR